MGAVPIDTLKPVGAAENAAARAELAELRLAIKRVRRDLTVRFSSMLVVAVAVIPCCDPILAAPVRKLRSAASV